MSPGRIRTPSGRNLMNRLLKVCSISLPLLLGAGLFAGIGYAERNVMLVEKQKVSVHKHAPLKPALVGNLLLTEDGVLDVSKRKALFFSPDAGCREALERVGKLPEEKRPYLVAFRGSREEIESELDKVGLSGVRYYRCRGAAPTITVPSLIWVEGNVKKEYTCSAAVEKLIEAKYPILLARAELPNVPDPAGNNAIRAMMAFNGAVVNPGEEFSFYGYVGVPSAERGYLPARSLMETPEGPVWVEDIGGGICKAATLLNNAIKETPGIQITEQHHHTRPVSFAPKGQDIAVARSSGWDYRFKNNRERPVQIMAYWNEKSLSVEIWELGKGMSAVQEGSCE